MTSSTPAGRQATGRGERSAGGNVARMTDAPAGTGPGSSGSTGRVGARLSASQGAALYIGVVLGTGVIGIGPEGHHGVISPRTSGGTGSTYISVYVDDVDAHYQRAVAAGARIATGLRTQAEYGHRTYEALDPEGHRWRFHQRLPKRSSARLP